jgi:hypothetical protein
LTTKKRKTKWSKESIQTNEMDNRQANLRKEGAIIPIRLGRSSRRPTTDFGVAKDLLSREAYGQWPR